jgi:transposase InsO family protein
MVLTKEADMGKKARKPTTTAAEEPMGSEGVELPERWSVQRKTELVLRLLRGEPLDGVSGESQVPAYELESWKRVFLETGTRGLKSRADPEEHELTLARAKIGELMMRLELSEYSSKKGGSRTGGRSYGDETRRESRDGPPVSADDGLHDSRAPRSTVYRAMRPMPAAPVVAAKRGPKTPLSDAAIVEAIRAVLAATPFHCEGYRKVRARLAHRGLAIGGKRVLPLMRAHHLLAPRRLGPPNGDPAHGGTITTTRPDEMWGTDATRFYTDEAGWCWFFGAIDHCVDELVGWHTAKIGDRWAALEPLRQGVRQVFGRFAKDVARGLRIRCDWGPQYIADAWINEVKWLGMTITRSYVGEPKCNGVIERFMRTLK